MGWGGDRKTLRHLLTSSPESGEVKTRGTSPAGRQPSPSPPHSCRARKAQKRAEGAPVPRRDGPAAPPPAPAPKPRWREAGGGGLPSFARRLDRLFQPRLRHPGARRGQAAGQREPGREGGEQEGLGTRPHGGLARQEPQPRRWPLLPPSPRGPSLPAGPPYPGAPPGAVLQHQPAGALCLPACPAAAPNERRSAQAPPPLPAAAAAAAQGVLCAAAEDGAGVSGRARQRDGRGDRRGRQAGQWAGGGLPAGRPERPVSQPAPQRRQPSPSPSPSPASPARPAMRRAAR